MLVKSFAQRLLVLFGCSCLLVFLFVVVWTGRLGPGSQLWLLDHVEPILQFYRENEQAVANAIRFVGYLGTGFMGLWSLHKAYYFSERNLPERIQAYIEQISNRDVLFERGQLIAIAEAAALARVTPSNNWFEGMRLRSTIQKWQELAGSIDDHLRRHKSEQDVLDVAQSHLRKQMATMHYLNGLHESDGIKVLQSFETAAALDPSDNRALHKAAQEATRLHDYQTAIRHWKNLADDFERRNDSFNSARAQYQQSSCSEKRANDPSLYAGVRRESLDDAKTVAELARIKFGKCEQDEKAILAFAETSELLGVVRSRLGTIPSAKKALNDALEKFTSLNKFTDTERVKKRIEDLEEPAS